MLAADKGKEERHLHFFFALAEGQALAFVVNRLRCCSGQSQETAAGEDNEGSAW